jgi:hypothetical protein
VICALAACAPPPRPPADVDGLARWFYSEYDAASDRAVAEAVANLHAALRAGEIEAPEQGRLSPLPEAADPGRVRGMLLVNLIRCPLAEVERLHTARDQRAIHPSFDRYERSYTSDPDAYFARRNPRLDWQNRYTVSLLGSSCEAEVEGGARFASGALLSRARLARPARFNNPDDYFRQDYQIQLFYERAPGEVVHLFAVWREMRFAGFSSDDDLFAALTLDSFARGDEEIEAHCAR